LLFGITKVGDDSSITGNIVSRAFFVSTPMSWGIGSISEINAKYHSPSAVKE